MGKQQRVIRTLTRVPLIEGGFQTVDLPRQYDYEKLNIRVVAQVQVTTAYATVLSEAPSQLIKRVEVVADGRNTLHSVPFWACVFGRHDLDQRFGISNVSMVVAPSAPAVATYNVSVQGTVSFNTPDGDRPKDSNLVTSGLGLFQLKLTFGKVSDIFSGAGVGVVLAGAYVEITTSELMEFPNVDGTRTMPTVLRKTSTQEYPAQATSSGMEIRLPAGNLIKSLLCRAEGATTVGETSNSVINTIVAASGLDQRAIVNTSSLRGANVSDFGPLPTGYYAIDFTRSGSGVSNLSELWNVQGQAEPKVILDVTGGANNKVQVVTTEYIPL